MIWLLLLQSVLCWSLSAAYFSADFNEFLREKYGEPARKMLERPDLSYGGSFGGREEADQNLTRNAVIFVHGASRISNDMSLAAANYYKTKGYTSAELYATSYGTPRREAASFLKYQMECSHVLRIRLLIKAVYNYTSRPVDIVAFSMGVPLARKAILGGKCVDGKRQYVGPGLKKKIGTFIGVAGPNLGISPVILGMPMALCAIAPFVPICNPIDGLFSGICPMKSKFLDDINRKHRGYEASRIFTIGSTRDEIVGHRVCGEVTTRIAGQLGEKIYNDKMHEETFNKSFEIQLAMIEGRSFR